MVFDHLRADDDYIINIAQISIMEDPEERQSVVGSGPLKG
jgi:hypothetical protein